MNHLITLLLLFSCHLSLAQHTFSIVAVDPITKEVGAAGATCIPGSAGIGGAKIISQLVPGKGGINSQAYVCLPNINLTNGIEQLKAGLSPEELIDWLKENDACSSGNFNPEFRQYGIVDLDLDGKPRSSGFTGQNADDYKNHLVGDNYAIQGNILLGPEVLEGMETAFNNTDGPLRAKLMAAMQGANIVGADSRCFSRGTSSTTAFLKVAQPDDPEGAPSLFLDLPEEPAGIEPIDVLQKLYDEQFGSTKTIQVQVDNKAINIYPNPTSDKIYIENNSRKEIASLRITDPIGRVVLDLNNPTLVHDLNRIESGYYTIHIIFEDYSQLQKSIIKQ